MTTNANTLTGIRLPKTAPGDHTLKEARRRCGEEVTAVDLRHYIYGVLHAPDRRVRFAAELEPSAPRFPWTPAADCPAFRDAGEELTVLHADFDQAPPHPGPRLEVEEGAQVNIGEGGCASGTLKRGGEAGR